MVLRLVGETAGPFRSARVEGAFPKIGMDFATALEIGSGGRREKIELFTIRQSGTVLERNSGDRMRVQIRIRRSRLHRLSRGW